MLCSIARWQLSSALDRGGERPRLCARHLARCGDCQAFARRLEALHTRLASGAAGASPPVHAGRRLSRPLVAGGLLAAGAAAVLFLLATREPARQAAAPAIDPVERMTGGDTAGENGPAVEGAMPEQSSTGPTMPDDVVARLSVIFTEPRPLRAELNALAADGRRGALAILELGGVRRLVTR